MKLTDVQLKEARIHLKQKLRKQYEAGEISKRFWKDSKNALKTMDINATLLKVESND